MAAMQDVISNLVADSRARKVQEDQHARSAQGAASGGQGYRPSSHMLSRDIVPSTPIAEATATGETNYPIPKDSCLGDMDEFDRFLAIYQEYRRKCNEFHRTPVSLSKCFSDMNDELAMAFSSLSTRRARHSTASSPMSACTYSTEDVDALPNDEFTRLFRELCAGNLLDKPSQIIDDLSDINHTLESGAELPYIVKVAKTFREKLNRVPTFARVKCTQQQLRDAFLCAVFRSDWKDHAPNYANCETWDQAKQALIQAATDQSLTIKQRVVTASRRYDQQSHPSPGHSQTPVDPAVEAEMRAKYEELMRTLDPVVAEHLEPEDRNRAATWGGKYNELSRRVRLARIKMRALLDSADASRVSAASAQAPRVDSRPRPPETVQVNSQSPPVSGRDVRSSQSPTARSTSRTRFPEGNCYRCGRSGHRSNECNETTDIYGAACVNRSRSQSRERPE